MFAKLKLAAVAWATVLLGVAAAADDAIQTLHAGAVTYEVPKAWHSERPSVAMRKAQIKVDPVAGDPEPAEMTVFALGGGGGGVEANTKRWEGQFSGEGGGPVEAKVEKKKGKNVDVTRVELAGKYAGMGMGGQKSAPKGSQRLLGAILLDGDTLYTFKLTGPDKTVAAASKAFDAMIASMAVEK